MVAGAEITATNQSKGTISKTTSNSAGEYNIPELVPGVYTVTAEHSGFSTAVSSNNDLAVNQTLQLNITLQVGQISSKVEVHATAPLLQTQTSGLGNVVEHSEFENLPLLARMYQDVASLLPGAEAVGFGDFEGNPAASGENTYGSNHISLNGMDWTATSYLVDGVHNQEPANSYQVLTPPLDSIQEISVQTQNPSAEFGTYGGGVVATVIRSGTNQFHGTAFEYLRNSALNSLGFFDLSKLPYRANQFGGSLGGPIIKNRWFYFFDYQGYRQATGTTDILTVPTALQRQGIFTEGSQNTIYNPLTGLPFANNTIPTGMINPIAANLVALYPQPNAPGLINNLYAAPVSSQSVNQIDAKTDIEISPRNRLVARESYDPRTIVDGTPGNIYIGGDSGANREHNAGIGLTSNISPTKVNELRIGMARYSTRVNQADANIPVNLNAGIPYGNQPGLLGGGVGSFSIAGWASFGTGLYDRRFSTSVDFSDNFIWQESKHTLKFGGDLQVLANTCCVAQSNGTGAWDGNLTSNQGAAGTGLGLASFLLGYPTSLGQSFLGHLADTQNKYLGMYFQDDFRVTKKLTLNLGLRYTRLPQPTEKFNDLANYDLQTGLEVLATPGDRVPLVHTFNLGFDPRIGLAYSIAPKTVIRSAYGMSFYNAAFGASSGSMELVYPFLGSWSSINPNIFVPSISINEGFPAALTPPVHVTANTIEEPEGYGPNVHALQRPALVQMWNFGVEHQFTNNFMVSATYVGNHATQVFRYKYLNLAEPGPGDIAARAPYADLGCPANCVGATQIITHSSDGSQMYDALQLSAVEHLARGLQFTLSYAWSKSIDDMYVQYLNPYSDKNTRGLSDWNTVDWPNIFSASYVYTLPFGEGNKWALQNHIANKFIGGWAVSGIARFHSGDPLNVWVLSSLLNNTQGNRANMTAGCKPTYPKTVNDWVDSSCFTAPALYQWGNSGIGHIKGPGFSDWDLRVGKQTKLPGEQKRVDVTFDFFNFPNHPVFSDPDTYLGDPRFGTITALAWSPRYIQIGVHLAF
jgi:hypothetical protein